MNRNDALDLGSAPASGAVGRALAAHLRAPSPFTFGFAPAGRRSARGRAEQQPRRLRSPFISTASIRLRSSSEREMNHVP